MSDNKNDVFYYDKSGMKHLTTCDKLNIPEGIFHSLIDNLNETLKFVSESALTYEDSPKDLKEICEKSIKPYSEAVSRYGYEFFISDISSKNEIINISCMLREI